MKEVQLEYPVNTTPKVLYNRIATATGLAEWFADDVKIEDKIYTFIWDDYPQQAEVLGSKDCEFIKFRWLENEDGDVDPDTFFEFRILEDELTGDISLLITDFTNEDEIKDFTQLWEKQVGELRQNIGS